MFTTLHLPSLESGSSALVEEWLVPEGTGVRKGQALLSVAVGFARVDIPASHGGTVRRQYVKPGQRVAAGAAIALVGPASAKVPLGLLAAPSGPVAVPAAEPSAYIPELPPAPVRLPKEGLPPMSPRARKRAAELGVPLQAIGIPAEGKRINERDVLRAAAALSAVPADPAARQTAFERGVDLLRLSEPLRGSGALTASLVEQQAPSPLRLPALREALTPLRRIAAEQSAYAQQHVPALRLEMPVRTEAVGALRVRLQSAWGKREAPGEEAIFLRALALVLREEMFRAFRAVLDGGDWVVRGEVALGFHVPLSLGATVVPVVRNADRLTLRDLSKAVRDLTQRARSRRLKPDEQHGALLTLCYLPVEGLQTLAVPVRPGEAAGIAIPAAMHRPIQQPDGLIAIKPTWLAGLAADQRLIDPALAAQFLQNLKVLLESPERLLE